MVLDPLQRAPEASSFTTNRSERVTDNIVMTDSAVNGQTITMPKLAGAEMTLPAKDERSGGTETEIITHSSSETTQMIPEEVEIASSSFQPTTSVSCDNFNIVSVLI